MGEWGRFCAEPVPPEELTKAKELIKGSLLLSMEDTHAVAGWYGRQEALKYPLMSVDEVAAAIDAVSAHDVMRVARDLFRNEWLNLAVVGPFRAEGKFARGLQL
jgi:predicted Zn-dependent peptidase